MSELDKVDEKDLTPENIYQYVDEFNIYGYIYRIKNNINGKTYVGLRKISKDYTWHSYWGSGKLIKQAIAKNGRENFTKELLYVTSDYDELCDKEIEFILKEKANGHGEYNLLLSRWDSITNIPQHRDPAVVRAEQISTYKKTAYRKYLKRVEGKEQIIIDTYKKEQHIGKTAKIVGISKNTITKFLHENKIKLNHQNIIGHAVENNTKNKISGALKNKSKKIYFNYCLYNKCDNYYSSTRKNDKYCSNDCKLAATKTRKPGNSIILPDDPEIIRKLYWDNELSATKIAEQYNCNEQTIRNYMKKNDIPIRTFKESSRISYKPGSQERIDISCLNCQKIFRISNFKRHYNYCINRLRCLEDNCEAFISKTNKNGYCIKHRKLTINICAHDNCDKELSKKEAKYCRNHMVITHSYKNCENCGKEVISSNYKRHYEYCINATICAKNKCKIPTKNSRSKYCWKH